MVSSEDSGVRIEELQNLEHNLQHLLQQKQTIQVELNEIKNAVSELKECKDECYRIIGGIMVKSNPKSLLSELEEKQKLSELRVSSIEKQESLLTKKSSELRDEITGSSPKKQEKPKDK